MFFFQTLSQAQKGSKQDNAIAYKKVWNDYYYKNDFFKF